jgi:hypothetical protein
MVDPVGSAARKLIDETYSTQVDSMNKERSFQEANDIWGDFRRQFPLYSYCFKAYAAAFPLEVDISVGVTKELTLDSGATITDKTLAQQLYDALKNSHYDQTMDLFMRFLWQDPFNRAWVIATATKKHESNITSWTGIGDTSNNWYWDKEDIFFTKYNSLNKWIIDNNKLPSAASKNKEEKHLARWCQTLRQKYNEKKINIDTINKLNLLH